MPNLQTLHTEGEIRPATASPAAPEGLLEGAGEIDWYRTDWGRSAGTITSFSFTRRTYECGSLSFIWGLVEIPVLHLEHKAALLLLQGQKLTDILIPNHELRQGAQRLAGPIGHVLLRVDPWKYWQSRPTLTGLKLAYLREIPDELAPAEVLGILVAGSAA
jgi:hypothetical protein